MSRRVYLVLGAAVRPGGVASPALKRRIDHAIECACADPNSVLLLTGGVGVHGPSEAEVMAREAIDAGVARDRLLLEERATSTRESARFSAELLRDCEFDELYLVTDAYHQRRARLAFRRVGLAARSDSPRERGGAALPERSRRMLREWVGLVWYWVTFRG